jgi:hypothetical protein
MRPETPRCSDASRHILPDVVSQQLVDEGLVAYLPALRLFTQAIQDLRIDPNRNEPACRLAERWAAHPAHRAQLLA